MKGKKVYLIMDRGVAPEVFTNMSKLCDRFPVVQYRTLIRKLRKMNYVSIGRYEIWKVIVQ